jgi:hypothetical protein
MWVTTLLVSALLMMCMWLMMIGIVWIIDMMM